VEATEPVTAAAMDLLHDRHEELHDEARRGLGPARAGRKLLDRHRHPFARTGRGPRLMSRSYAARSTEPADRGRPEARTRPRAPADRTPRPPAMCGPVGVLCMIVRTTRRRRNGGVRWPDSCTR